MIQFRRWLFLLGLLIAATLMAALILAGFSQIGKGILAFFNFYKPEGWDNHVEGAAIAHTLKGLEFLFLAPLPFLVFNGIGSYINEYLPADGELKSKGKDSHGDRTPHTQGSVFVKLKANVVGLMIAVIATDLVSRALINEGFDYRVVLTRTICIVALGLYYCTLEYWASKH